jgi:hypothetical protein
MAKKKKADEPAVRKSFLVFGGVIIGVAILGFVVSTFLVGGGGGGEEVTKPISSSAPTTGSDTSGSTGTPATGATTGTFPKNELKPGGKNPFSPRAAGAAASTTETTVASAAVQAAESDATHTWQMLELKSGSATILVDGKKKVVKVGETLADGYKLNSVTGKCVTVKGSSTFGLCPGAQPITV